MATIVTHTTVSFYPGDLLPENSSFSVRGHVYDPNNVGVVTTALVDIVVRDSLGNIVLHVTDTIYKGYFSYAFTSGLPAGDYTAQVTFLGDAVYLPSTSIARAFTVTPAGVIFTTKLTCYWDVVPTDGVAFAIHGHLSDLSGVVIGGKMVTVTVKTSEGTVIDSKSFSTMDTGWYSTSWTLAAGSYIVDAAFAGDTLYQPSTASSALVVSVASARAVTIRGKCTGGYPLPSMLLEIYDNGVQIKSSTIGVASIGSVYEDSIVVTSAGIHGVQGRMVLTNPFGSYEFLTETKEFTLG